MKAIPKSSSCLGIADYVPYLTAALSRRSGPPPALERTWGTLLPGRSLVATPTGRHAWWYFLEIAGLQPGDEVLVPAYNLYVMVRLLLQKGLVPVFVDVEPQTLCIDPAQLERKISRRSRLVLATHMFGHPANLREIAAICRRHGLMLFEDCAHAVGTLARGEPVGRAGDGALFSFGVEKLVNSFGGGMLVLSPQLDRQRGDLRHQVGSMESFVDTFSRFVVTCLMAPRLYRWLLRPGERLGERLESLGLPRLRRILDPSRDDPTYRFAVDSRSPFKPFMERMHRRQLARREANVARRRRAIQRLEAGLADARGIGFLDGDRHGRSNGAYFGVYVPDPWALSTLLQQRGIGSSPQEFQDCSQLEQFAGYHAECAAAAHASSHLLRLPSFPALTGEQCDHITLVLRNSLARVPAPGSAKTASAGRPSRAGAAAPRADA